MITYKIDKQLQSKTNSQIRDMAAVLGEISPTLELLREMLEQHQSSISSPSINDFRAELTEKLHDAILLTREIDRSAQKLVTVSEQASKHLSAIEEHFGAVLRDQVDRVATPQQV